MILRRMYVKKPGWKFKIRFAKIVDRFNSSGCYDDYHNIEYDASIESEVCDCDRNEKRRELYGRGFKEVGYYFEFLSRVVTHVLYDGNSVVLEHHSCGR